MRIIHSDMFVAYKRGMWISIVDGRCVAGQRCSIMNAGIIVGDRRDAFVGMRRLVAGEEGERPQYSSSALPASRPWWRWGRRFQL